MADTGTTPVPAAQARPGGIRSFLDRFAWLAPANLAYLGPTDLTPLALSLPRVAVPSAYEPDDGADRATAASPDHVERLGPEIEWIP